MDELVDYMMYVHEEVQRRLLVGDEKNKRVFDEIHDFVEEL